MYKIFSMLRYSNLNEIAYVSLQKQNIDNNLLIIFGVTKDLRMIKAYGLYFEPFRIHFVYLMLFYGFINSKKRICSFAKIFHRNVGKVKFIV